MGQPAGPATCTVFGVVPGHFGRLDADVEALICAPLGNGWPEHFPVAVAVASVGRPNASLFDAASAGDGIC